MERRLIVEHIADWRPFSYLTTDYPMGEDEHAGFMRFTYDFEDRSDPPTMTLRIGGSGAGFEAWWAEAGEDQLKVVDENTRLLFELLDNLPTS